METREDKFDFENLVVYERALDYVNFVYQLTNKFPKSETFALADQFKRASTSICLNVAEGSGGSKQEFGQFLKIARRSVRECVSITEIAFIQSFIDPQMKSKSRDYCFQISKMINSLLKSLKRVP